VRNNGPETLVLERFKLRELAEGWPCYRFVKTLLTHSLASPGSNFKTFGLLMSRCAIKLTINSWQGRMRMGELCIYFSRRRLCIHDLVRAGQVYRLHQGVES
jgi:hypothetical protein